MYQQQTYLTNHQPIRRSEILCFQPIEIDSRRNTLSQRISPIPLRRTVSGKINPCRLLPEIESANPHRRCGCQLIGYPSGGVLSFTARSRYLSSRKTYQTVDPRFGKRQHNATKPGVSVQPNSIPRVFDLIHLEAIKVVSTLRRAVMDIRLRHTEYAYY